MKLGIGLGISKESGRKEGIGIVKILTSLNPTWKSDEKNNKCIMDEDIIVFTAV